MGYGEEERSKLLEEFDKVRSEYEKRRKNGGSNLFLSIRNESSLERINVRLSKSL